MFGGPGDLTPPSFVYQIQGSKECERYCNYYYFGSNTQQIETTC